MAGPFLKGELKDISISPKHKDSYKKKLHRIDVDGEEFDIYGDIDAQVGDAVCVWKNDRNGQVSYNVTKDKPMENTGGSPKQQASTYKASPATASRKDEEYNRARAFGFASNKIANMLEAQKIEPGMTKAMVKMLATSDGYDAIEKAYADSYYNRVTSDKPFTDPLPKFDGKDEASE